MTDKFDCIIIGAGPSGIACAYKLAKAGLISLSLKGANIRALKMSQAEYCIQLS